MEQALCQFIQKKRIQLGEKPDTAWVALPLIRQKPLNLCYQKDFRRMKIIMKRHADPPAERAGGPPDGLSPFQTAPDAGQCSESPPKNVQCVPKMFLTQISSK